MKEFKYLMVELLLLYFFAVSYSQKPNNDVMAGNTVLIGNRIWMTKNLNVSKFGNGDPIHEAKSAVEWQRAGEQQKPAWCYYNNDPANGPKFGKLYNWYAVFDPRKLAPEGWYLAGAWEWDNLVEHLCGVICLSELQIHRKYIDPKKLEPVWYALRRPNCMDVLAAGCRFSDGKFDGNSRYIGFWISRDTDDWTAWAFTLLTNTSDFLIPRWTTSMDKSVGFSVRCVRSANTQ